MENPKFQIGDKVIVNSFPTFPQTNSVHIIGVISSATFVSRNWRYIIRAEKGYNSSNDGKVLSEWKYENHNKVAFESELEKVS